MDMKKMGFLDKVIFILGMTLAGVIAFVLLAGVIVAVLKFCMDSKKQTVQNHSSLVLDDDPKMELVAVPFEQRLSEVIQLYDEAAAGNANAVKKAKRAVERLRRDHPGHAITDAYHGSILVLLAKDSHDSTERRNLVRRGLKLLNEAVSSSPQDPTIRMLHDAVSSQ